MAILVRQLGLTCFLAANLLLLPLTFAADDCWPRYAHDRALTGHTSLKGDIRSPRESWSLSLAGVELEVELLPQAGEHVTLLPGGANMPLAQRSLTAPAAPLLDVAGSGQLVSTAETPQSRWAKVLLDVKGLQQIRWNQTQTTVNTSRLELIAYDQGHAHPRTVWQSEPQDTVFAPLTVVYDIDGDGVAEICVAMHYRVLVFEGTTGRMETELRYHSSRSYGWFGLADVDADGQMEMIVLADFQSHFEVLDYDPQKPEPERLSVVWKRDVELQIEDRAKWPQVGPRPVVDVTGDSRPEIVINLYNDSGDGEWHTLVLDAATGDTLFDLPRRYTHGNADVDGDGKNEIFCTTTDELFVPEFATIEVRDVDESTASVLWTQDNAGFSLSNLPGQGPTWASGATQGGSHVLLTPQESRPAFLVLSHGDTVALSAIRLDTHGHAQTLWNVAGFATAAETVTIATHGDSAAALVRVRLPANQDVRLTGENCQAAVVGRGPLGSGPLAPIATRLQPEGPIHVLVEGAGENIFAVQPPTADDDAAGEDTARILWQRPGRGMGNDFSNGAIAAVDLDNDGSPEIIAARRSTSGAAEVVAYRADAQVYWQHTFTHTPGARPRHNAGALAFWWPGHFRSSDDVDLFVNTRRGLMHSDVGHLLDGRTGQLVWSQEKAVIPDVFNWGYTGIPVAVANVSGDERDELVNLYPVCYWIADGATGQLLNGRDLATREVVPAWAAYGEPIVWDFDGDSAQEVLLDSIYILALLDASGQAIWHGKPRHSDTAGQEDENVGETTGTRHALVDFDADGNMEIASAGYKDGVRAIDPRSGEVLWSLAAPSPTRGKCAAADIDGSGGDELIYVAGNTLVAITGDRNSGQVLWTWEGPAALSLPAIADVDGDRLAEIVVQSADGVLHCIDGAPATP